MSLLTGSSSGLSPLYTAGLFRANNRHPPGNNGLFFSQCANRAGWASSTLSLHRISSIQIITEFLALNHPSISNPDMDFLRDCPLTFPLPNSKNRPSGAALRLCAPPTQKSHTGSHRYGIRVFQDSACFKQALPQKFSHRLRVAGPQRHAPRRPSGTAQRQWSRCP